MNARDKHTPGPWRKRLIYRPESLHDKRDGSEPRPYGSWYIQIAAGKGYGYSEGFGLQGIIKPADARLIAAAPELLAALQNCVDVGTRIGGFSALYSALDRARAVIAAATEMQPEDYEPKGSNYENPLL